MKSYLTSMRSNRSSFSVGHSASFCPTGPLAFFCPAGPSVSFCPARPSAFFLFLSCWTYDILHFFQFSYCEPFLVLCYRCLIHPDLLASFFARLIFDFLYAHSTFFAHLIFSFLCLFEFTSTQKTRSFGREADL